MIFYQNLSITAKVGGFLAAAEALLCFAQLSPPSLSLSLPPSEFCTDEDNSVIRSAMDALRYSKK
jgi:hypothetical protein